MNKLIIILLLSVLCALGYMWKNPESMEKLNQATGYWWYNRGRDPALHVLTSRVSLTLSDGIKTIPVGTEVKMISDEGNTVTVSNGQTQFPVSKAFLSRDPRLRTGAGYTEGSASGVQEPEAADAVLSVTPIVSTDTPRQSELKKQIEQLNATYLSLADQRRMATEHDAVKGRVAADPAKIAEFTEQMMSIDSQRVKLKEDLRQSYLVR